MIDQEVIDRTSDLMEALSKAADEASDDGAERIEHMCRELRIESTPFAIRIASVAKEVVERDSEHPLALQVMHGYAEGFLQGIMAARIEWERE